MDHTERGSFIIAPDEPILITGATGFIGVRLIENLLNRGFRNLRCFVRPSSKIAKLESIVRRNGAGVQVVKGNLLSRDDCVTATKGVKVVFHLAAARGEKSFPDAFMNSGVTTRNLLEACVAHQCAGRFVNISSFAVYTNRQKPQSGMLDEWCPTESCPQSLGDAYSFAKAKQDEIVTEYGKRFGVPYVIVRPGFVYGPGNLGISGRVGIGSFGVFLHLGGSNTIPLTYVDNCADAIALAGLQKGVDGQVFNVVDDDLPSSRQFLRLYKSNVRRFTSFYVPHALSYALCYVWEKYSLWSEGQLEPVYNRKKWHASWKRTRYSNKKIKTSLGWEPRISTDEGLRRYFQACREARANA